ncbi:hypothetical protein M9Y10_024324 [Tritrichomonas musculus]|uniref:Uncharacterized protein n=1 Tax=Tritrichomonas musculus TaxID=1915356 RepID=A0ABR2HCN8_9EUKA
MLFFKNIKGDSMPTPKVYPISVSTKMMDKTGDIICDPIISDCPQENFEDPSVYSCGQLCWTYNGNATFSYTFKGIQFMIYGRHNQTGRFNLFIDDENLGEIIEMQSDEKVTDLLYTSRVYKYGNHTIRAEGQKVQIKTMLKLLLIKSLNK